MVKIQAVLCYHCGQPTRHLASRLERIIPSLTVSAKADQSIPHVCPHCMRLGPAAVAAPTLWPLDQESHPDGLAAFVVLLKCADKSCESHLSALVPMRPDITESQTKEYMKKWQNLGMMCPKGVLPADPWLLVALLEEPH